MIDTIPGALLDAVERFGDDEAVVGDGRRLSFLQLREQAEEVGRALLASGVERGDRVALWAPNSADWVIASFGVYLSGAVLVPLNTRYKGGEAAHVLRTSEARLLIGVTDMLGVDILGQLEGIAGLDHLRERVVLDGEVPSGATSWQTFLDRAASVSAEQLRARAAAVEPEDTSDIIFTSGTTGAPKGAMLTHGASVRTYREWTQLVGLRAGDRYLVVYPFFHTAGLKSGVLAAIMTGATVLPHAVFDVPVVMRRVAEERVTMLPGPPTVFQSILNHPDLASFDLSSLRLSVTGAAVVPESIIRRMYDELRLENVVTGYGLTETTGTVSMCRHDDPPDVIATTVGKPLPGVEVRIVDDEGTDQPAGSPGEIIVRGFNVMRGYFNDPGATEAAIDPDGWLHTGDIGLIDEQGNLHITDRKKDMFIVGGFNAYPAEIEAQLLGYPGIAQVAVVGIPDDRLGEVGVAFVVAKPEHILDAEDILTWARAQMANFKVPRRVEVVSELPLNPSGKVMKYVLRDSIRAT